MTDITYTVGEPCPNEDECEACDGVGRIKALGVVPDGCFPCGGTGRWHCGRTLYDQKDQYSYDIVCPDCGVVWSNVNPEVD